ncbi:4Fe-4S binding protein [Candidatus Micrarchaeota archaeon]|nr:4Fe-4S binding protein [Candidatus Micrarchaeota archaeon]
MEEKRFPEFKSDLCAYCGACVAVCPVLALDLKETKLFLDKNKCIKCMSCTKICPVGALK